MATIVRVVVGAVGALTMLGGLAALATGWTGLPGAAWAILSGGVMVVAVTLERTRYRSQAAEVDSAPSGPGGGETGETVDPRFQVTSERFVDPTSHRLMEVLIDPRTGERRYRAIR
ncbi:MAG: hypothetical protein M3Y88_07595 [Chloroflexota bacterium]|nr:hypothetical protein [Chloroflexota bacterium]